MPIASLFGAQVTVTEKAESARLRFVTNVLGTRNDFLDFGITVVNLLSTQGETERYIGAAVSMDKGKGSLERCTLAELDPEITLRSSADGFIGGTSSLTFRRFGADQAPAKSSLLRAMRRVTMEGYRGVNGVIGSRPLFDGYVHSPSWDLDPPAASITCQDASLPHVDKLLTLTIPAFSGKTRRQVIIDVCSENDIPLGTIAFPNFTGGEIFKPITEGGNRKVLEWMREFIVPTACHMRWSVDGKLNIVPFSHTAAPARSLKAGDIRACNVSPPETNLPNQVVMTSTVYANRSADIIVTDPPVTESSFAVYAPEVATHKQDTAGVVTPLSLTSEAVSQEVSRIVTTNTWRGGTLIERLVEEWGWYAPQACNRRQRAWNEESPGLIEHNTQFAVYKFADGTWRTVEREEFQVIRRSRLVRTFNDDGNLTEEKEHRSYFVGVQVPISNFDGTATEFKQGVLMLDDGRAWEDGKEKLRERDYVWNVHSFDASTARRTQTYRYRRLVGNGPTHNIDGAPQQNGRKFGPLASPIYTQTPVTSVVDPVTEFWSITWTAASETSHRRVTQPIGSINKVESFETGRIAAYEDVTLSTPVPTIDQLTSSQVAQPQSYTFTDGVRVALRAAALGVSEAVATIPMFVPNDYCETELELRVAAVEKAREMAPRVVIEMDVDMICDVGETVDVTHPKLGHGTHRLPIEQIDIMINTQTGANTQRLTCRLYGPELQAA